eukprot:gene15124-4515_t
MEMSVSDLMNFEGKHQENDGSPQLSTSRRWRNPGFNPSSIPPTVTADIAVPGTGPIGTVPTGSRLGPSGPSWDPGRIQAWNFRARQLDNLHKQPMSSCYLRCDYAGKRTITTEYGEGLSEAIWATDVRFEYSLTAQEAHHLSTRFFTVEAYWHSPSTGDQFIGSTRIDLLTAATGPVSHELNLRDGDRITGVLTFDLLMEQKTIALILCRDIRIATLPMMPGSARPNPYLSYNVTSDLHAPCESPVIDSSCTPFWEMLTPMRIGTTLKDLVA